MAKKNVPFFSPAKLNITFEWAIHSPIFFPKPMCFLINWIAK